MTTLRILMLTKYDTAGASSRVRMMDWVAPLAAEGFSCNVSPLLSNDYIARLYAHDSQNWRELLGSFLRRIRAVLTFRRFDLIWVEKELFPWLPGLDRTAFRLSRTPVIVDIDDAVFHYYDLHPRAAVRHLLGHKMDAVFAASTVVLAGNSYLADRARRGGARWVEVVPTVVEEARYTARKWPATMGPDMVIGWIGSPATDAYLEPLAPTLRRIVQQTASRVVLIGASTARCIELGATSLTWSTATEVSDLQGFDVGLMPLPDEPFERGKCGFKLIQYMACGIPVIASPVGVNIDIVEHGVTGFLATTPYEWHAALAKLSADPALRRDMGAAGRERFERRFSREGWTTPLAAILAKAAACR